MSTTTEVNHTMPINTIFYLENDPTGLESCPATITSGGPISVTLPNLVGWFRLNGTFSTKRLYRA